MKIVLDTHSHTVACGHAYNTINEMAMAAKEKGLELLAITDHGPNMPYTAGLYYFENLKAVRREKYGVKLMMGAEVNIIDYKGSLDLEDRILAQMDLCIASLHCDCCKPGTMEENTNAYIGAMKNPHVHIIGHPDDRRYPIDYERLVKAAKEYHVLIELNNASLSPQSFRKDAKEKDIEILNLCKKYGVPITMGTDSHVEEAVGDFTYALEVVKITNFPEEMIMNGSVEKLKKFIDDKKASC